GIGLTAADRDTWATERQRLLNPSTPSHAANFAAIESALSTVCLDDHVDPRTAISAERAKDHDFHNGDARNRWMDKLMEVVALSNGRTGMTGEHAVLDGMAIATLLHAVPARTYEGPRLAPPRLLKWNVGATTAIAIQEVKTQTRRMTERLDTSQLVFTDHGARWLQVVNLDPETFVQLALQLAYYRLHKRPSPTYASFNGCNYLHDRELVFRSYSNESAKFTQAILDPAVLPSTKFQAMTSVIANHRRILNRAIRTHGIDNHLLGLRAMVRTPEERARSSLFNHPAFTASAEFITVSFGNWRGRGLDSSTFRLQDILVRSFHEMREIVKAQP
ncbi:Carnitine O-acetyltransferase mitochondrial, partial [Tieghemiomyces parasiticus]